MREEGAGTNKIGAVNVRIDRRARRRVGYNHHGSVERFCLGWDRTE